MPAPDENSVREATTERVTSDRPASDPAPAVASATRPEAASDVVTAATAPPASAAAPATPDRTDRKGAPLSIRSTSREDLRRRLVVLTVARLAVASVLLGIVTWFSSNPGGSPTSRGVLGVVIALYAASLGYAIALRGSVRVRVLGTVQIALDLASWTALVYVTGGPGSPLSFFFGLSALTAALVLGEGAARTTALIAVATYGALVVGMTYGFIVPLSDAIHRSEPTRSELALQLVTNTVGILLIAALGGSLASRLSRAGGALARAEASRAALAALYEDVLRSIPVALVTCTPDGTIDGANPQAGVLFDVLPGRMLGTPITRWLPFLPKNPFAPDHAVLAGDETLVERPSHPHVAYRAAPLFDREGRPRGGLVVIEDRSTVESMREAMQRAERLAVLGRLAAGLAHEIRNPLGAISGCVELVREAPTLGDEDRALLVTILRETGRLNRLVTDMLTFARPRQPERTPTDLRALVREVVTLHNAEGPKTPVQIDDGVNDTAPVIASVDAEQMRQVVWNLVRNASQASPPDKPVQVFVRTTDRGDAELSIADRGAGIAEDVRERIFDVFYSEKARGTGLGLAIVKQIVDAHGGRIEVRPREGGGSQFVVTLPRSS